MKISKNQIVQGWSKSTYVAGNASAVGNLVATDL